MAWPTLAAKGSSAATADLCALRGRRRRKRSSRASRGLRKKGEVVLVDKISDTFDLPIEKLRRFLIEGEDEEGLVSFPPVGNRAR